jgi:hypothetical protein
VVEAAEDPLVDLYLALVGRLTPWTLNAAHKCLYCRIYYQIARSNIS